MANAKKSPDSQEAPRPDPALKRLNRFVGTWRMKGHAVGSRKYNITGTTTFKWLHGKVGTSLFLQQDMEMDYAGTPIKSREIIGYDTKSKKFSSYVYSNMAGDPWPYVWDVRGDEITISIEHGPMDATFTGAFSADGSSFAGGWRPNAGADKKVNAPYDIVVSRVPHSRPAAARLRTRRTLNSPTVTSARQ